MGGTGADRSKPEPDHGGHAGHAVGVARDRLVERREQFRRWRDRVKSRRVPRLIYRTSVAVIGLAIAAGGLLLVPLPGPGWLIVLVGLAILASEFAWAERLLRFVRDRIKAWTQWLREQSWAVRALVGAGTLGVVAAVLYALLAIGGVPNWLPGGWLSALPGLES